MIGPVTNVLVDLDVECTRSHGLLASTAQAHRHGAAVMTANVADFRPFDHLLEVLAPVSR